MKNTLIQTYTQRVENYHSLHKQIQSQSNVLALVRVIAFAGGAIGLYIMSQSLPAMWSVPAFLAWIGLFFFLVKVHTKVKRRTQHLQFLIDLNQAEIKALQGDWSKGITGEEWAEPEHPYGKDLDIFGVNSIFQWLNRSATVLGVGKLADWLKKPCLDGAEIQARQEAVQELGAKLDWRQNFRANGQFYTEAIQEPAQLLEWLSGAASIRNRGFYQYFLRISPAITLGFAVAMALGSVSVNVFLIPFFFQLLIVGLHTRALLRHSAQISKRAKLLRKYAELFALLETESWQSNRLVAFQKQLTQEPRTASRQLTELANLIFNMENGQSMFGLIFNGLVLWSVQFLYRFEGWQSRHQGELKHWLEILAEADALCSLANVAYNQPQYTFPKPTETPCLQAEALGHPLLPAEVCVTNPADFPHVGRLVVITGANMAGKSTYLRTVAVNLLLAMTGAPVCATGFRFRPMAIFTSMRTQDSLQAHESFFYAELKRLKLIIDTLRAGNTLFIILDEILKGTNSADQHAGSEALLRQLIKLPAVGLIATHDLRLGELAAQYPQNIQNQCFEIEIQQDELAFDYKLRSGLNQHLNATFLMRKMGIVVEG
jgi:hypothetical protein